MYIICRLNSKLKTRNMAYSSQRQFFKHNLDLASDEIVCHCKTKLKRYESSLDNRAWSPDLNDRSRFLSDIVTCKLVNKNSPDSDFDENFIRAIEGKGRESLESNKVERQSKAIGLKSSRKNNKHK